MICNQTMNQQQSQLTKIAIVTTIRAERENIQSFINYHLNINIDHLFIFFDNPNDENFGYFNRLDNISCILCNSKYWKSFECNANSNIEARQVNNANLALKLAQEMQIDWIAHIDIDELIYANSSLKDILDSLPQDIDSLWLPPLEAIPKRMHYKNPFKDIHIFKQLPDKTSQYYKGECPAAFFDGEYFRGHIGGKSITKISNKIKSLNLHKPIAQKNQQIKTTISTKTSLLHYDCFDFNAWFTKWIRRLDGTATASGRDNRMTQFKLFQNAYNENNENNSKNLKKLYKRLYFLSGKTRKTLEKNNMLTFIYINQSLFDSKPKKIVFLYYSIKNRVNYFFK